MHSWEVQWNSQRIEKAEHSDPDWQNSVRKGKMSRKMKL